MFFIIKKKHLFMFWKTLSHMSELHMCQTYWDSQIKFDTPWHQCVPYFQFKFSVTLPQSATTITYFWSHKFRYSYRPLMTYNCPKQYPIHWILLYDSQSLPIILPNHCAPTYQVTHYPTTHPNIPYSIPTYLLPQIHR